MNAAILMRETVPADTAGWPGPIDFRVDEGDFCVVTAPAVLSGVMLRLCTGQHAPARGTVEVLGLRPAALDRLSAQAFRRRLGVAFAEPAGLISNQTVRLNIIVPLLYGGVANAEDAARIAAETVEACGLIRWADVRPADLPPDARRKAVLARAIARRPELLLLEEPVTGLREADAIALLELCRTHARTVLAWTTDDDGPLFELATRTAAMDENRFEVDDHEVGIR